MHKNQLTTSRGNPAQQGKPMTEDFKDYLAKVQTAFPRLKLFAVKNSAGYQATGKFGLLPEKPKTEKRK